MQRADPAAIGAEIERIRSLRVDELRKQWRMTFGFIPPRALTKDLIARMITYRLQEEAFGGLDRATIKLLDRLSRGEKPELNRRLKAGTGCISCFGCRVVAASALVEHAALSFGIG
jgi:Protein of unknown function (DUF2924)